MLSVDATVQVLWLATPVAACVSGLSTLAAISGTAWLSSQERVPNPAFRNGSSRLEYLTKCTVSGLFTLCVTEAGKTEFRCSRIDYFPGEAYSPDPQDATMAIPHTVVKSVWFFLTAAALLGVAEVLCLQGHCCSRRRFLTFLSGVTFVLAGLVMLLGLVMYIATLKGLVADKLRRRSPFQPALFTYSYGWCFLLVMLGFLTSEAAGMAAIFLYIYWYKREWRHKRELVRGGSCPLTLPQSLPRSPSTTRRTRGQYLLEYLPLPYYNHVSPSHYTHVSPSHYTRISPSHYTHVSSSHYTRVSPNHQGPPGYQRLPQDHTCRSLFGQGKQDSQNMAPHPPSQQTGQPPHEGTGLVAGACDGRERGCSGQPRTHLQMDVSWGDSGLPHPRQGGPLGRGSHGRCDSCAKGACRGGGTLPRSGSWGATSHSRDDARQYSSLPRTGLKLCRSSSSPPTTGIPGGGRCEDCCTYCCYCCCCCCCCRYAHTGGGDEADCTLALRTPLPTSKLYTDPSSASPWLSGPCQHHHTSPSTSPGLNQHPQGASTSLGLTQHRPQGTSTSPGLTQHPQGASTSPGLTQHPQVASTSPGLTQHPQGASTSPGLTQHPPGASTFPGLTQHRPQGASTSPGLTQHPQGASTSPGLTQHPQGASTSLGLTQHRPQGASTSPGLTQHPQGASTSPGLTQHPQVASTSPGLTQHPQGASTSPGLKQHPQGASTSPGLTQHPQEASTSPGLTQHPQVASTSPGLTQHPQGASTSPGLTQHPQGASTSPGLTQHRPQGASASPGLTQHPQEASTSPDLTQHRPQGCQHPQCCQHPQQQTHWFQREGTDGGAGKPAEAVHSPHHHHPQRRTTPV